MEAIQWFVCICWWASPGLSISQRSLCLLPFLFLISEMAELADSVPIMKQLCVLIYCFMQLFSGEAGVVGRSTCPRNLASCRLATTVGKYHKSRAIWSTSRTCSSSTCVGRSDFSLGACRSCVSEGSCWMLHWLDLPCKLQGSHSSTEEFVALNICLQD